MHQAQEKQNFRWINTEFQEYFHQILLNQKEFNKLMSQIDVMPTLFGLLKMNYSSKFYGQNVFDVNYKPVDLLLLIKI